MSINYRDLTITLLVTSVLTMIISNFIGYHLSIAGSIPGILILAAIAFVGISIGKVIPIKIPIIIYVVLLGLLVASPISPVAVPVIQYTSKINPMTIITAVGTLAGLGIDFKSFKQQSWKMFIIAILIFTGAFLTQAIFAEVFLRITHKG